MTTYTVKIEGQSIPLPEEIGATDDGVKRALAPYYPEAANAMITRVEKDGNVEITVIKRAGTKGAVDPVLHLITCPEGRNPAVEIYEKINRLEAAGEITPLELLTLEPEIQAAITEGQNQAESVDKSRQRLTRSTAQPSPILIPGI